MFIMQNKFEEYVVEKNDLGNGLFHGNAGICLFYHHAERKAKQPELKEKAEESFQSTCNNLKSIQSVGFGNGLAGIGWTMEYLRQNDFINTDIEKILEFVDDAVFNKIVNSESVNSLDLTTGLTGYLFYCISRLENPVDINSPSFLINKELIIFIINKIDEIAIDQFTLYTKDLNFDLFWSFPVLFYGLTLAYELNIYNYKINCMITQWIDNLEVYFPSLHINRIYMAMMLSIMNKNIKNPRIERQRNYLLSSTDFKTLKSEIDPTISNIRHGWYGIIWILKRATRIIPPNSPNYDDLKCCYQELRTLYKPILENSAQQYSRLSQELSTQDQRPVVYIKDTGLSEGWPGISLMEMINPALS